MIKNFALNETNVIMNFSVDYCTTKAEILASPSFKKVLAAFLKNLQKQGDALYNSIDELVKGNLENEILDLFKLLLVFSKEEVIKNNPQYKNVLTAPIFLEFIEDLYTFWRHFERYAVVQSREKYKGIQNVNFIEATNNFNDLVLDLYRTILVNVRGEGQNIFRQLAAGINCGISLSNVNWELPAGYECLKNVAFIDSIVLRPPFIVYSKKNKREGVYKEANHNPLEGIKIKSDHWFCYPAYVGESLAYVYFHRDYMSHGIALCNLFSLAKASDCEGKKPDLVYVFGAKEEIKEEHSYFYHDKKNDIYVGIAYHTDDIDYFGYMKKMMLTLHNTRMIDKGYLPIHGAMVKATFKDGRKVNLAFMGDSGAGKSETLEALKAVSGEYLKSTETIFDDMGTFVLKDGKIKGYGTEIGAFVRLDDLDPSYAYTEMDRAVFMNPNKSNSRVIMPVNSYENIMKGENVDIFLYANNYTNANKIKLFENTEEAIPVFRRGARMAKGTTGEKGLVDSYFANPFGPVQRQEQTEPLLDAYFKALFDNNIPVGEMYTKLGIPGEEKRGPQDAAIAILEWIKNR